MLRQRAFYAQTERISNCNILFKFKQCGPYGYLPVISPGACAFTSLDFNRAFSQNTFHDWAYNIPRITPRNRFALLTGTLWGLSELAGLRTRPLTPFAARQQYLFENPLEILNDPLFLPRIVPFLGPDRDDIFQRVFSTYHRDITGPPEFILTQEETSEYFILEIEQLFRRMPIFMNKISQVRNCLVSRNNKIILCVYITFQLALKRNPRIINGHCIALCIERDGPGPADGLLAMIADWKAYLMDPNCGVISMNKMSDIPTHIQNLFNLLYSDFNISNCQLVAQQPFWETHFPTAAPAAAALPRAPHSPHGSDESLDSFEVLELNPRQQLETLVHTVAPQDQRGAPLPNYIRLFEEHRARARAYETDAATQDGFVVFSSDDDES